MDNYFFEPGIWLHASEMGEEGAIIRWPTIFDLQFKGYSPNSSFSLPHCVIQIDSDIMPTPEQIGNVSSFHGECRSRYDSFPNIYVKYKGIKIEYWHFKHCSNIDIRFNIKPPENHRVIGHKPITTPSGYTVDITFDFQDYEIAQSRMNEGIRIHNYKRFEIGEGLEGSIDNMGKP